MTDDLIADLLQDTDANAIAQALGLEPADFAARVLAYARGEAPPSPAPLARTTTREAPPPEAGDPTTTTTKRPPVGPKRGLKK